MKKIIYVDMDGVIADFDADVHLLGKRDPERKECTTPPSYFVNLKPVDGAIEALHELSKYYEIFILSTPQWSNVLSYSEKREWIGKHYPELLFKKLILSHDKTLLRGDYLIDDIVQKGVFGKFEGEHIHFGTEEFPNWDVVVDYLVNKKEKA